VGIWCTQRDFQGKDVFFWGIITKLGGTDFGWLGMLMRYQGGRDGYAKDRGKESGEGTGLV